MGLFSRRRAAVDAFGATPGEVVPVVSAPAPVVSGAAPVTPVVGPGGVIDARGIPGLRQDVMRLALSGGSPEQIMQSLREHGIAVPDGTAMMMPGAFGVPSAAAADAADPAERLRRLEELRAGGLITEEEHASQRARILEEL